LKKDSLGISDIYLYSNTSSLDTQFYELKFSYLGANKGNYIQGKSLANGRVFQWVAPINGIPQGDFEPVVQLIAPNQRQLLTAAYQYADAKGNRIQFEMAGSNDVERAKFVGCRTRLLHAQFAQFDIGSALPTLFNVPHRLAVANEQHARDDLVG
jgi:hypothetical protein